MLADWTRSIMGDLLKTIESVDEESAAGALKDTRHGKSNTS